jgi:NifB/MoaA-like Fe-S oxidoreductase
VHVENRYFGDTVTIAGLLGGRDIIDALQNTQSGDLVVLPAEALNADDIFIDDVTMSELQKALTPALICTGYEVTEALRSI